jgi:hypothetical protein
VNAHLETRVLFCDTTIALSHTRDMPARRSSPLDSTAPADAPSETREVRVSPELEAELLEAMAEIDRGEYIELTFEQLDHAAATGEWPWPDDESLG